MRIKSFVSVLLLAVVASAETARIPSGGFCDITTVSTVGVITYAAGGSCSPAEGQVIFINNVRAGNNMHPVNSRADANHRYRKIKVGTLNLGARTFQVTDMADVDVANTPPGGGSALSGTLGFFGAVSSPYTVRSSKGGWLDGPGGAKTIGLADAAKKAGTPYTSLTNMVNAYKTWRTSTAPDAWGGVDYLFTERHSGTLSSIIKYLSDSTDTAARDVAIADLKVPSPAIGTASCSETINNCGLPATSYADYSPSNFALWQALAATYVDGEAGWGSADRERISRLWLNDNCWYEGGLADSSHCPGQSPGPYNALDWKIHNIAGTPDYAHGTTATTASGASTVTINGGNLVSDGVAVGDIVFFPHPSESSGAAAYKITAVTATTLTLAIPLKSGLSNTGHFAIGRDWTEADMGMAYQRMHFGGGYQYGCGTCFHYPPQYGEAFSISHNLPLVRMMGEMATGLYACGSHSDQIGCHAAERALFWYYHTMLREALVTLSNGFNSTKFFYNEWRMNAAHGMVITMVKNWLSGGPDWNYGSILQGMSNQWRHLYYPGRGVGPWMPFTSSYTANYYMTPLLSMNYDPSNIEARYAQDHILNVIGGYTSGNISYNGGSYAHWHYLLYDPTVSATASPTGSISRNYLTECEAIWSSGQCVNISRNVISTRTGWSLVDSIAMLIAASISPVDQVDQNGSSQFTMFKNNTPLIWGDTSTGYGNATSGQGSILQIGSTGMLANVSPGTVTVPWNSTGTNHTFGRAVLSSTYDASSNVTLAERQLARAGEVYFLHDYATTSTSQPYRSRYHLPINGCGSVTSATCIALDLSQRTITSAYPSVSPTTGMLAKAIGLGSTSTIAMVKESGTAGNISYMGGAGLSGRVELCPSSDGSTCANGTSYEAVMVMIPTTGSGSVPTITTSTVGSHRVIEVASPAAVVALTAGGATATSLTFTTSHSGSAPYLIAGLPAGVYNVTRNGTAVSGSPFTVASSEGSLAFSSTSGTIAAAQSGLPLNIDTVTLPGGTAGVSYSATLSASGGTPAYTWSLASGSFSACGLTLSSAGVLSGTMPIAGTCAATVQVTDDASGTDTQLLSVTIASGGGGSPGTGFTNFRCTGCKVQ